ncbi:MAG: methionine gamma-lyase family protein [Clostridia bacterium]|nr:methionine gamma-lyase family protein [Clostridia bacterium]
MDVFSQKTLRLAEESEQSLAEEFRHVEHVSQVNTERILRLFEKHRLSERHFNGSCGYGYNDDGRDLCDLLFAESMGRPSGFARISLLSGTHALTVALQGLLRPGDVMLSVTGKPYDTLDSVIGIAPCPGSLAEFGITYEQIDLIRSEEADLAALEARLSRGGVRVVYAQRSKGYDARRTLTVSELNRIYEVTQKHPNVFFVVDNCYGEFVETEEPKADLLVGSLIKNPGGGMAESGGYIVGTEEAVRLASYRLSVPGMGLEVGASFQSTKSLIKGLFYAPHTVCQALKTMHFAAALFERAGCVCSPSAHEIRSDIIQVIECGSRENMLRFCKGIQNGSPVDSNVTPEGWAMPGYHDEIVMAAGAFVQGSSIELSADGPLRPPFRVYLQGGLTYESGKYGIMRAFESMFQNQ